MKFPVRVGLTGGVGSGKSCVAALMRQRGIPVVDLDQLGREITAQRQEVIDGLKKLFGDSIAPAGVIDRRRLRELAFDDPKVRKALETHLHPLILEAFEQRCRDAAARGSKLVVCEAALLIESGHYRDLDKLTIVLANVATRRTRIMARDKITEELADKMISAQVSDQERTALADYTIENNGSLRDLVAAVERTLGQWRSEGFWLPR